MVGQLIEVWVLGCVIIILRKENMVVVMGLDWNQFPQ